MNSDTLHSCPIAINSSVRPEAVALVDSQKKISYLELEHRLRKMCAVLKKAGVTTGERVAILSANSALVALSLFALHRIGASGLFLSLQLTPADWRSQLALSQVKLVIGQETFLNRLTSISQKILTESDINHLLESNLIIEQIEQATLKLSQEAAIIFTSSTSGHKKGVILSINNFLSSATASNQVTQLSAGDTWAVSLPLYHVGGLGILYRTLLAGASSYMLNDFSARTIFELLTSNKLTHLSVVPTVLEQLLENALEAKNSSQYSGKLLGSLKAAVLAGAASSKGMLDQIVKYQLPVLSAWGMTETTAHCTCMRLDDPIEKVSTVGKPFPHTQLKLVDDDGNEVANGEEGEILVNGPTVCMGYIDPNAPQPIIRNGWLCTGDVGKLDKSGYLSIVGRKDDMFISGGENIHSSEIEAEAMCYPLAKNVAVVPVAHPKWGQRPVLFVEPRAGQEIDPVRVTFFLKERLAKIKVPDQVITVKAFPKTAIGKIDYRQLKKDFGL